MNHTTNQELNTDYTGYFDGKPCRVYLGESIEMSFGDMTTAEMVESKDFQILESAGFEVHRDWRDTALKIRRRNE